MERYIKATTLLPDFIIEELKKKRVRKQRKKEITISE